VWEYILRSTNLSRVTGNNADVTVINTMKGVLVSICGKLLGGQYKTGKKQNLAHD